MRADVSGGGSHEIAVLEDLAILAGRLHRPEKRQRGFGRRVLEFKNPFQILARQAGAGADEILDQNVTRRVGVSQFETRINFSDGLVPAKLPFIHQLGEQQGGHAFGVRGRHEQRVLVHRSRLAKLAYAKAAFEDHFSVVRKSERSAGNAELAHRLLHKIFELRDACRIEMVRLASSEHLALVALWSETLHDK